MRQGEKGGGVIKGGRKNTERKGEDRVIRVRSVNVMREGGKGKGV